MPLSPAERETLRQAARRFAVDLDDAALDRLGGWLDRVYAWQARRNVTAVDRRQAVERHLIDSLVLAAHLPDGAQVLDVGTGAGFPGMVLALAREDLQLTLAERSSWLAARIEQAIDELALSRVSVLSRDLRPGTVAPGRYDALVSRAALKPPAMVRLARKALAPGGVLLLQLGPRTLAEYRTLDHQGFGEDAAAGYRLGDGVQRTVVRLRREVRTG